MKKIISITALASLVAFAGCGTQEPAAKPAEAAAEQVDASRTEAGEAKEDANVYTLEDENGTVYTLDLNPYTDDDTDAADEAIAEAMAYEDDVDATDLDGLTEWASLTIDNTKSSMESGSDYVDITIVGDEMQYGIITDPSDYVAELTWMSEYGGQAEAETYNRMLDVADAFDQPETVKPGVKVTYPVVLELGLPETVDAVWCWDQEMK
ncbi:hypothetical protein [Brevibacterium marinum]|uniref:Putative small lipoprotein YifL n=1 Tax=Brevibacterium marinum TaxID=418643 RepID=A0A846S2N7_9MICO|nr:hypothetical protein [Brevibacterium marinum]NJC57288.1 putative small lipoprotein YifL [Brevibacterium marinum]